MVLPQITHEIKSLLFPAIRGLFIVFSVALALAACSSVLVYDPMEFPLESRTQVGPASGLFNEMARSRDLVVSGLGRAMAELPDFHDNLTDRKMDAAATIEALAARAAPRERALLAEISKRPPDPPHYGAPLQGLLWMAEDDVLTPERFKKTSATRLSDYAFQQLPRRFQTPDSILDYLAANYAYVLNRDTSQTLSRFFESKHGDCNEFSLLAGYLLKKQGYRVYVLHTRPSIWGRHVSVIFRQKDGYHLMDPSRAAILRVLENRKESQPLQPVDLQVRDLIKGFDRIHGPAENMKTLVGLYNHGRAEDLDYRIETFEEYERDIQRQ